MSPNRTAHQQSASNLLFHALFALLYFLLCCGVGATLRTITPRDADVRAADSAATGACRLCNFTPTVPPASSSTDLIITFLTSFNERAEMMFRSIRSTGCRATIVCFTPHGVSLPKALEACGVKHVSVEFNQSMANAIGKFRWETYQKYLKVHWHKFERVMHTDAYDAFFFGDPFAIVNQTNALFFQSEEMEIGNCPYNRPWIERCFDENVEDVMQHTVLCSGSLIGGIEPFMKFMSKMIGHPGWLRCLDHNGYDQGAFNYAFYTNQWDFHKYILPCNSPFVTLHYCERSYNFEILSKERRSRFIYIHQYNRYNNMVEQLNSICNY